MTIQRTQELPVHLKGRSGWHAYVFDGGYVTVYDENKKLLSAHYEGKTGGGTKDSVVQYYIKEGWTVVELI